MFKNALKLMRQLRSLAINDSDEIWIDHENKTFSRVHDANGPIREVPFPENEASVSGLLYYLQDEGLIIIESNEEYLSLTYKAFYYEKIRNYERTQFVLKSVLVPIAVTLATNFVLLLMQAAGMSLLSLLQQLLQRLAQIL